MRKHLICSCCILLYFSTLNSVIAQTDSIDNSQKLKPQLKLSVNYNSNLNFFGRTDSLKSSGLFPMLEFWMGDKFYVNATPILVNNAVQSFEYAGTVATAGYQQVTEKWITSLSLVKPFYQQSATLPQSALKAQTNISFTRLNPLVNITVGADAKFSDKTDFGATAGLDKTFILRDRKNGVWVIDPSFYAFAGTRQFSRTYTKRQSGLLPVFGGTSQQTVNYTDFSVLAYEASLPLFFIKGKVMLMATPSYVLPQNLLKDPANPSLSEQGENTFYTTVGIKYSF